MTGPFQYHQITYSTKDQTCPRWKRKGKKETHCQCKAKDKDKDAKPNASRVRVTTARIKPTHPPD